MTPYTNRKATGCYRFLLLPRIHTELELSVVSRKRRKPFQPRDLSRFLRLGLAWKAGARRFDQP